jgi:hypothetical protein
MLTMVETMFGRAVVVVVVGFTIGRLLVSISPTDEEKNKEPNEEVISSEGRVSDC